MSETLNQNIYEKINPKTKKVVKIIKGTCSICNRNKSQILHSLNMFNQNRNKSHYI